MRLLILAAIIFLCYRALKSWMVSNLTSPKTVSGKAVDQIDDVMIKDPFCEVYFPRRNAVHLRNDGRDLYFCSNECHDNYVASHTKQN